VAVKTIGIKRLASLAVFHRTAYCYALLTNVSLALLASRS